MARRIQNEDRTGGTFPATAAEELLAAQVKQLYGQGRTALVGSLVGALVLTFALWGHIPASRLVLWCACYIIVQIPRFMLLRAFGKASPGGAEAPKWVRLYSYGNWAGGFLWGVAAIFLFSSTSINHQYLLAVFVTGIACGAAVAYSPIPYSCYPTIVLELGPLAARFVYEGGQAHMTSGVVMAMFIVVLISIARNMNEMNAASFKLSFEKNDLIATLTAEKKRAEDLNRDLMIEINERCRVEEELRKSEQRLDLALGGADLGLWDWNMVNGDLFLDRNWTKLLGYDQDEIRLRMEWLEPLIHPDDRPAIRAAVKDHLSDKCPIFETENRFLAKSGQWKWLLCRGRLVERDARGTPTRMTGTCLDITERKVAEARIRGSLDEKEVLLREIHHRVKNNLQVMSSLLRLQRRSVDDERYSGLLMESESRIASMALVHERLYQSPNLAEVDAREYLDAVVKHVAGTFATKGGGIRWNTAIEEIFLGIDVAITLGLMVTELCSNCFKHAFPMSISGEVFVGLNLTDSNGLILTVGDNGVGMAEEAISEEPKSLGLRLVRILANQLHARLDVHSGNGTEFRVEFETPQRNRSRLTA